MVSSDSCLHLSLTLFLTVILQDPAKLFQYTAYPVSLFHDFLRIGFPHFSFHHHTNTIFELLSHHIPPSTISPSTVPERKREKYALTASHLTQFAPAW